MVREILKIYIDDGSSENPTFHGIQLTDYTFTEPRMGMPSLTATLIWPSCLDKEWSGREYVTLRGERYYISDVPSSQKADDDTRCLHELVFRSERDNLLGGLLYRDVVPAYALTTDRPCSNSTTVKFYGTIREFIDRLNCAFLEAGVGDSILKTKTDLTTDDAVTGDGYCAMRDPSIDNAAKESHEYAFEDKYLWQVITDGYGINGVPFMFRGKQIVYGAVPAVVDKVFRYGPGNELLKIKKNNANARIINRITMSGSSENIPYYYPNETEYGHISAVANPKNSTLKTSQITIANMRQMLSAIPQGATAVYNGGSGNDTGNYADVNILVFAVSLGDDQNFVEAAYGQTYSVSVPKSGTSHIYVMMIASVNTSGNYMLTDIEGNIWSPNTAPPTDSTNLIETVRPVNLGKTVAWENISDQMSSVAGGISLGYLESNIYRVVFAIDLVNRDTLYDTKFYFVLNSMSLVRQYDKTYPTYWQVGDKRYESSRNLGVVITGSFANGDGFSWEASGRMNIQGALMPTKYRETNGEERFYNAINQTYIDPDTGKTYEFKNTYDKNAPSEYIYRNEKIKPTIAGMVNSQGQPFDEIAGIAFDSDDNDSLKAVTGDSTGEDDSLKYEHSFFYIKLNRFDGEYGFDLLKHATQSDPMTIQMTSGPCAGCKFKVQVLESSDNGLEVWSNPVQTAGADGDIVGGSYSDKVKKDSIQTWQQDTTKNSIWICVQKDADTFGTIIPNKASGFRPNVGDTFSIINIDLPLSYVRAAEKQLETEGIRFMADNNEDKFTFSIEASRIFFANNPGILQQIDAYSKLKIEYDGIEYELYVSEFTIVCRDNEALPDIRVELTDTLAVGESFVSRVANEAASLIYNPYTMSGGGGGVGVNLGITDKRYLNKTTADRSPYKIASDTAFEVGNFISGACGGIFFTDETGKTWLETDMLKVRMKAVFEELLISKVRTVSGELIVTPGGGIEISYVEELEDVYRCYFKSKEEDKGAECSLIKNDQVICRQFNIIAGSVSGASNRYYWRVVMAVNNEESYVDLAKGGNDADGIPLVDGTDAPMIGDSICQLGYRGEVTRQTASRRTAVIISTVDADAPSIKMFSGIKEFALNKRVIGFGYDKTAGSSYFTVGDSNDPQYLTYTQKNGLKVKGEINVESPLSNGGTLGDALAAQESIYRLDLTPSTGAVQCDAAGNITAEVEAMPYTLITVYKGNARLGEYDSATQAGYRLDSIETTEGVYFYRDTTRPQGTYTMQKSAGMTADTATATFNVSVYENGTKVASLMAGMSIYKVRPGQGGPQGEDGQPAIRLVLSQELIAVPCSADGEPLSGTFPIQVTASLFRGDKATVGTFRTQDEEGCTTTHSGATLTVTEMTANDATFTAVGTETSTGASAQLNVSLYKVIPGADGEDGEAAVVYTLEPNVMVIKRDIDGKPTPSSVSCITYKTTGNADRVPSNEKYLYFRRTGAVASNWVQLSRSGGQSPQVNVDNPVNDPTTEEVLFGLFATLKPTLSTQPLAMARIPVLTDAADLEGSGVNLLRNTNQGTKGWTNDLYAAYATGTSGEANPRPLPSLTESNSVPPGVVETNSYKYPFGKTSVSEMPTTVEYQMFFNLPEAIVLQKGRKYTLSFDARVAFRGTDLTLDYGINASPNRESLGALAIGASVIRVQKTFTIGASADKTASSISIYVRLANANVNGTGSYDGKGRSQFDSIVISNLKLEMGSLATGWTPAPGDMHYLTQAFRESTTISGGVVMTSRVRVGYTDKNGAWHETGGLNGIAADYEGNVMPNAPILYCGGSMEDKGDPEYASSSTSATSMIRLDGSAYFANNTVRFRENTMEMGDSIVLQKDGLRLFDPASGEERLFITNGSVGTLSDIGSIAPQTINLSRAVNLYFYLQEQTSGTSLSLQNGYYLKRVVSSPMYIYDKGTSSTIVNDNTTLQATVSISFTVPSYSSAMQMKASLAIVLQTAASGSYTWTDVASYPLRPANTQAAQTTFTASANILASLSKGMRYRLSVVCTKDEASRFAETTQISMATTATGQLNVSRSRTVLGNDGLATVWGNAAILVKENEVHLVQGLAKVDLQYSKTVISQGNTMFEIDDGRVMIKSEWDGNYTTFRVAPGGILIDTPEVTPRKERQLDLKKLADAGYLS